MAPSPLPESGLCSILRRRTLHSEATSQDSLIPLASLAPGDSGIVTQLDNAHESDTARRLFDLGFTTGATITLVRRAPFGGPLMVRIADSDLLLRRAEARGILIAQDSRVKVEALA